jgi:hypothetical protein
MLAGHARSGSSTWQGSSPTKSIEPTKPPSPEVLAKPTVKLPSSNFVADYSGSNFRSAFKATIDPSGIKPVSTLPQGFCGRAIERYPSGETYVGDYADGKRHGSGTFSDYEGDMLSCFVAGQPRNEGTLLKSKGDSHKFQGAVRTYDGKKDDDITMAEAAKITKNIGMAMPVRPSAGVNFRWAKAFTSPLEGKVRSQASSDVAVSQPPSDFLARLDAAEERDDERIRSPKAAASTSEVAASPTKQPAKSPARAAGKSVSPPARRNGKPADSGGAAGKRKKSHRPAEFSAGFE